MDVSRIGGGRQNNLICASSLTGIERADGVQIESSLLLLSRVTSGFLGPGFRWHSWRGRAGGS